MKGRKRKPTNLIVLEGNPGKRKRSPEPLPASEIPDPPEHLDAYALAEWNRLAPGLYRLGLLYDVDRAPFASYCMAYSRWRTAEEEMQKMSAAKNHPLAGLIAQTTNGNVVQSVLVGIANKAAGDMVRYAAEFGLTPAARARLAIDPGKQKKSKFEGLIGANGGKK